MGLAGALFGRRGAGCLPDPRDQRDWHADDYSDLLAGASGAPAAGGIRSPKTRIRDQNGSEACTGFAVSVMLREALLQKGYECPELSALFPYFVGRAEWGGERRDGGSFLRTTCRALQRYGCPAEKDWAFSTLRVNRQPSWQAFRGAHPLKGLLSFYRIRKGTSVPVSMQVRNALTLGYPVVGGWLVTKEFQQSRGSNLIDKQVGPYVGGHALGIDEYYDNGARFGIVNSYGERWRNGGTAEVTDDFVEQAFDLWVLRVELS